MYEFLLPFFLVAVLLLLLFIAIMLYYIFTCLDKRIKKEITDLYSPLKSIKYDVDCHLKSCRASLSGIEAQMLRLSPKLEKIANREEAPQKPKEPKKENNDFLDALTYAFAEKSTPRTDPAHLGFLSTLILMDSFKNKDTISEEKPKDDVTHSCSSCSCKKEKIKEAKIRT